MINPIQLSLTAADGSKRNIIIEPALEKQADQKMHDTGVYKLYKDGFGEESALFTEPLEIDEKNEDLSDDENPDYLGTIKSDGGKFVYTGELLSVIEQEQVFKIIVAHQ